MAKNEANNDPNRICFKLNKIIYGDSSKPYDIRDIIESLADFGNILEAQDQYTKNRATCFIRIGGYSAGIIANQPKVLTGCLDINASDKGARFIKTCDAFNIPVINFMDVPGLEVIIMM